MLGMWRLVASMCVRMAASLLLSLAGLNGQLLEPSSLDFQPLDQDPRAPFASEVKRHQEVISSL